MFDFDKPKNSVARWTLYLMCLPFLLIGIVAYFVWLFCAVVAVTVGRKMAFDLVFWLQERPMR